MTSTPRPSSSCTVMAAHARQGHGAATRGDLDFLVFQTTTETGSWTWQNWRLSSPKRFSPHGFLMFYGDPLA